MSSGDLKDRTSEEALAGGGRLGGGEAGRQEAGGGRESTHRGAGAEIAQPDGAVVARLAADAGDLAGCCLGDAASLLGHAGRHHADTALRQEGTRQGVSKRAAHAICTRAEGSTHIRAPAYMYF